MKYSERPETEWRPKKMKIESSRQTWTRRTDEGRLALLESYHYQSSFLQKLSQKLKSEQILLRFIGK